MYSVGVLGLGVIVCICVFINFFLFVWVFGVSGNYGLWMFGMIWFCVLVCSSFLGSFLGVVNFGLLGVFFWFFFFYKKGVFFDSL